MVYVHCIAFFCTSYNSYTLVFNVRGKHLHLHVIIYMYISFLPLLNACYVMCLILVAPFVEVIPQTVTVIEGGNITLDCNISGVPAPSILWTQIGSSKVVSHNSSLTIVNVSRPGTSDNMIQYQCTASNGVETPATATVNVTVHCK